MERLKASMAATVTNGHEKLNPCYEEIIQKGPNETSNGQDEVLGHEQIANLKSENCEYFEDNAAKYSISCAKCNFTAFVTKTTKAKKLFRHVAKCCYIKAFTCSACFKPFSNLETAVAHARRLCNAAAVVVKDR